MSAVPVVAPTRPRRHSEPDASPRRHLEVAPSRAQRRARPRLLPALVTIGGIGVILLAQLVLSIVLANGAYQISSLQSAKYTAVLQQHALSETYDLYNSPQHLAANAEALGMVASGNAVYLNAKTGAVTGTATAAGGSLLGAGDQVGNALLKGSTVLTAQPATPAPTPTTPTTATTTATGPTAGATTTNSTGASQASTDTGTGGAGQAPQAPALLPSPTTH
ncbi:MAG: hypothetical protein HIU88_01855 [Acidobacteria bacterium]|nr:hypothetical protein [Acidobacteriota bacterium]